METTSSADDKSYDGVTAGIGFSSFSFPPEPVNLCDRLTDPKANREDPDAEWVKAFIRESMILELDIPSPMDSASSSSHTDDEVLTPDDANDAGIWGDASIVDTLYDPLPDASGFDLERELHEWQAVSTDSDNDRLPFTNPTPSARQAPKETRISESCDSCEPITSEISNCGLPPFMSGVGLENDVEPTSISAGDAATVSEDSNLHGGGQPNESQNNSATRNCPEAELPIRSPDTPPLKPIRPCMIGQPSKDDDKDDTPRYRKRQREDEEREDIAPSASLPSGTVKVIDLTGDDDADDPIPAERLRGRQLRDTDSPLKKRRRKTQQPRHRESEQQDSPSLEIPRDGGEVREFSITDIVLPVSFSHCKGYWEGPELGLELNDKEIEKRFSEGWSEATVKAMLSTTPWQVWFKWNPVSDVFEGEDHCHNVKYYVVREVMDKKFRKY